MESNQTASTGNRSQLSAKSAPCCDDVREARRRKQDALLTYGTQTRRAIFEELYDFRDIFRTLRIKGYATRTCDPALYSKNERKLEKYLSPAKQKEVWTKMIANGVRGGELTYASRKIREFHRWVYVTDLLVKPEFDPESAAKKFSKTWQYDSAFREIVSPKFLSLAARGRNLSPVHRAITDILADGDVTDRTDLLNKICKKLFPKRNATVPEKADIKGKMHAICRIYHPQIKHAAAKRNN
jgi:hypothetical protein